MGDSPSAPRRARRVAHVLAWPTLAGTEISTLRIAQSVTEFDHVAFCSPEAMPVASAFQAAGIPTATYRPADVSYRRPGPFLGASLRLAREFRRRQVALVHCSDFMAAVRAALAGRFARLPVLCHIRNPHPHVSSRDRPFLWAVNRFVFVSRHAEESFGYPVCAHRGSIVYDGIAPLPVDRNRARQHLRAQLAIPPDVKLVGMVGRLASQKDHVTLLRAAARVVRTYPRVRFLIVGDHASTDDAREHHRSLSLLVAELRLDPYVTFTGYRDDVPALVSALDVSLLVTHFEGFGLVLVEAMAQGTPVVGTAVGGVTEIVTDQTTGLLHRHGDAADLAAKILALLSDQALAERLGARGRSFVEERFSMARFAENIARVYRGMLPIAAPTQS